ncbi:class I SAM-dependent methyltransferase [Flavobacterium sp.]|uniref:class I SAM-dependent methyltransferase n=1 Tax=Flavobacterium sp. TaxID=239 RepID=UPI003C5A4E6B
MNILIRKFFYLLPVPLRFVVRRIIYLPKDLLLSKKTSLIPPKGLIFTGRGDYLKTGANYFLLFKKYCDFNPDSDVLDIGCGIGRMAISFTNYLSPKGKYEGFDIVKIGIDWCTKNISSRFPNFTFKLIPLKNDLYLSNSDKKASELVFPYKNESFDLVFLTSVFTHMLPNDLENYISEIQRVLKTNQKCFATFFLLDEESKTVTKSNQSKKFPHDMGTYALMDKSVKEANIAYDKKFIFELMQKHNLEITDFLRGNWSGIQNSEENEHQDIIIFKKK